MAPCCAASCSSDSLRSRALACGRVLEADRKRADGRRRRPRLFALRARRAAPPEVGPASWSCTAWRAPGSVEAISTSFVAGGYAVLAYDARGHGASEGVVTLAGPREVADLRAVRDAFAARADVMTESAPGGSRTAAARSGTLSPQVCRSRPPRSSRPGRRSTTRSGRRASLAQGSSPASPPPSPALAAHRRAPRERGPEHEHAAIRALTAERSPPRIPQDPHPRLPLPGSHRLRLRHLAGDTGLRGAGRAEAPLRGPIGRALDLPRAGHRVRALGGKALVRPPSQGAAGGGDWAAVALGGRGGRGAPPSRLCRRRPRGHSRSPAAPPSAGDPSPPGARLRSLARSRAGAAGRRPCRCRSSRLSASRRHRHRGDEGGRAGGYPPARRHRSRPARGRLRLRRGEPG